MRRGRLAFTCFWLAVDCATPPSGADTSLRAFTALFAACTWGASIEGLSHVSRLNRMSKELGERIAILSPRRIRGRVRSVELVHPGLHADLSSVPTKGGLCRSSVTESVNHKRGKFLDDLWEDNGGCLIAGSWTS